MTIHHSKYSHSPTAYFRYLICLLDRDHIICPPFYGHKFFNQPQYYYIPMQSQLISNFFFPLSVTLICFTSTFHISTYILSLKSKDPTWFASLRGVLGSVDISIYNIYKKSMFFNINFICFIFLNALIHIVFNYIYHPISPHSHITYYTLQVRPSFLSASKTNFSPDSTPQRISIIYHFLTNPYLHLAPG